MRGWKFKATIYSKANKYKFIRERVSLFLYTTSKVEDSIPANETTDNSSKDKVQYANKEAPTLNDMPILQGECEANNNTNICPFQSFTNILIFYEINQPVESNTWDGEAHSISIFGTMEFLKIDFMNMMTLLLCMANFIKNRSVKHNLVNNVTQLKGFSQAA